MIDDNAGPPSEDKSPNDALLGLLARLVARRFLQQRVSPLQNEKCSNVDAPVEEEMSLDLEEKTE